MQENGGSIWLLGKARRTFNGAANVKVEFDEKVGPIEVHLNKMHANEDVWDQYITPILAKNYKK